MLDQNGSGAPPQTSAAAVAEEIGRTLQKIKEDMAQAAIKAAEFKKAYRSLWSRDAVRKDPIAARLLMRIAKARTPARLRTYVEALAIRLDKLSDRDLGGFTPTFVRVARTPGLQTLDSKCLLLSEAPPRRTFLML